MLYIYFILRLLLVKSVSFICLCRWKGDIFILFQSEKRADKRDSKACAQNWLFLVYIFSNGFVKDFKNGLLLEDFQQRAYLVAYYCVILNSDLPALKMKLCDPNQILSGASTEMTMRVRIVGIADCVTLSAINIKKKKKHFPPLLLPATCEN